MFHSSRLSGPFQTDIWLKPGVCRIAVIIVKHIVTSYSVGRVGPIPRPGKREHIPCTCLRILRSAYRSGEHSPFRPWLSAHKNCLQ